MLMNIETLKWDQKLLNFFDIDRNFLPEIRSSSEIYGHVVDGPIKGVAISGVNIFKTHRRLLRKIIIFSA